MSDDIVKCKLCQKECKGNRGLASHLRFKHNEMTVDEYNDLEVQVESKSCGPVEPFSIEDIISFTPDEADKKEFDNYVDEPVKQSNRNIQLTALKIKR